MIILFIFSFHSPIFHLNFPLLLQIANFAYVLSTNNAISICRKHLQKWGHIKVTCRMCALILGEAFDTLERVPSNEGKDSTLSKASPHFWGQILCCGKYLLNFWTNIPLIIFLALCKIVHKMKKIIYEMRVYIGKI